MTGVLGLTERPRGVMVLGAHPDDIEIGCGGTLLRLAQRWPGLPVTTVVMTGVPDRRAEAQLAAQLFLGECDLTQHQFELPDGRLPSHWDAVKQSLEDVAAASVCDVVLAPRLDDAHQDHRLIAQLVPTVWRSQLVLGYEIPKWDGDMGRPNVYVTLDDETAQEKIRLLHKAFPSQAGRDWWDDEMFLGLARLRGMECKARYAEGFFVNKAEFAW